MIKRILFLTLIFGVLILNYGCDATEGSFEDSVPGLYSLTTTVSPEEAGTVHPDGGDYAVDTGIEIEARPSEGYLFDRWEGDLTGDSNPELVIFSSDISVTAYFTPKEYTLIIEIVGNGTVKESVVNNPGDNSTEKTIQLTAEAADGWHFDRWEGDLSGSDNPETITVDTEKSITAVFEQNAEEQYILSIKTEGQGSVTRSPDQDSYTDGDRVTLTAAPSSGWSFKQWKGDLSGSTNPVTITVDKNKSVTAVFEEVPPDEFTLSIKTEGQGSVTRSPDQDTYTDGERVTLTAAPSSGWSFKQWKGDLSVSTNPVTITIDKNKSVTAVFEEVPPDEFTLSIKTEGQGSVTRSPDQDTYTDGDRVTLTAAPSSGWSFKQWKGDLSGSTNPATITIDKNKSVTAVFEEDPAGRIYLIH
jgi:ribosomal protein L11